MQRLGSVILILCCAAPALAGGEKPLAKKYVLPGATADGFIQLPNAWTIKPAGKQIELGDFPVNMALHPSGKWLAVLHAGWGTHEIIMVELEAKKQTIRSRVILDQTFQGIAFSPDGKTLVASGGEFDTVHVFNVDDGYLLKPRQVKLTKDEKEKFITGGVAVFGKTVFACGVFGHAVSMASLTTNKHETIALEKGSYPYTCIVGGKGSRLYVSLWAKAAVAVIDLDTLKVIETIPTEKHPTEMVFGPGEKTLYVACSNSTRVSVIRTEDHKPLETINCALYANAPNGNTPNSLSLTPDGEMLFVANADANNVAVFNVSKPGQAKPLGFILTGIYPTAVRYNPTDKRMYVANGRGATPKANPKGPNPLLPKNASITEYIANLYRGTLSVIDLPDEEKMVEYNKLAYLCSPLNKDGSVVGPVPKDNPIPAKIGLPSPIKYVVYVIRENRTYDQVFGDVKEGNGDPNLCIFPEKVTPNAHRLAKQFVLLDNFYCDGEVSAEGHEWTMGAYCTDFVKKIWPLSYRGSTNKKLSIYPAEGQFDDIARPAGGYLWDRCAEAKVTYRSYGEWIENGKTLKDPGKPRVKALEGEHFDPWFHGYDLDYLDVKRAERFIEEMHRFEKEGAMPQLQIVRLPNDHTYGTKVGKPTPTAMVAENDLALGIFIEAITKSKFWKETAVFIIEDDAQNGSDHVDAHRTVALAISPYIQHGTVDSTMYSTSSMLRTMELILGLKPMSQFDAAARPMFHSFQPKPNFATYTHIVPDIDMKEKNKKTAWGAKLSDTFDFTKEDAADDLLFGEVVWRSVKGADSPMPPPVHAAFVFPHLSEEELKEPAKVEKK